jgi:Aspartokinases
VIIILGDTIENVKIFNGVTLVTIYNMRNDGGRKSIFRKLAENAVNLDMISQSPCLGGEITLSFSLPDEDLTKALAVISDYKANCEKVETNVCSNNIIISFFSAKMINSPGVAASVFEIFANHGIEILLVTTSDISISCMVAKSDEVKIMRMLTEQNLEI